MDDLISRAAAIEAAIDGADDWDGGYNSERERYIREHMAKVPAVDAVPVEWLRDKMRGYASALKSTELKALVTVMQMWQKEQEADIAQKLGIEPKEG